jgi:hypothetical protein
VECRRLGSTGEPGRLLRSREGTRLGRAREGAWLRCPRLGPGE